MSCLPKSIKKVVRVASDSGHVEVLHQKKSKTKKQSKRLKPLGKLVRGTTEARLVSARTYLDRHDRSNRRKKNGWARNLLKNLSKSRRAGAKVRRKRLKKIF